MNDASEIVYIDYNKYRTLDQKKQLQQRAAGLLLDTP